MLTLQKAAADIPQGKVTQPGPGEGLYGCEYQQLAAIQVCARFESSRVTVSFFLALML